MHSLPGRQLRLNPVTKFREFIAHLTCRLKHKADALVHKWLGSEAQSRAAPAPQLSSSSHRSWHKRGSTLTLSWFHDLHFPLLSVLRTVHQRNLAQFLLHCHHCRHLQLHLAVALLRLPRASKTARLRIAWSSLVFSVLLVTLGTEHLAEHLIEHLTEHRAQSTELMTEVARQNGRSLQASSDSVDSRLATSRFTFCSAHGQLPRARCVVAHLLARSVRPSTSPCF